MIMIIILIIIVVIEFLYASYLKVSRNILITDFKSLHKSYTDLSNKHKELHENKIELAKRYDWSVEKYADLSKRYIDDIIGAKRILELAKKLVPGFSKEDLKLVDTLIENWEDVITSYEAADLTKNDGEIVTLLPIDKEENDE